jgi:hypothetical protein
MRYYVDLDTDAIADKLWDLEMYPGVYPSTDAAKTDEAKNNGKNTVKN